MVHFNGENAILKHGFLRSGDDFFLGAWVEHLYSNEIEGSPFGWFPDKEKFYKDHVILEDEILSFDLDSFRHVLQVLLVTDYGNWPFEPEWRPLSYRQEWLIENMDTLADYNRLVNSPDCPTDRDAEPFEGVWEKIKPVINVVA